MNCEESFHMIAKPYEELDAWQLAEGFGRFRPRPFAQFVEFAVASAMETKDSLKDGVDRGYFAPERAARAQKLAERSIQCSTKLIVYLKTCRRPDGERRTLGSG